MMQISVHPGCGAWGCGAGCCSHGHSGGGVLGSCGGPKSINGMWPIGSKAPRPLTFIGRLGPSPSGCSRCASPIGGGGPVIGGRSTGTTPVAYAAAQPSTFWA
ncbi:hypothetical protein LAUMK7_04432 [Mycobacterium kansasii]|nr:hypothetical protein LAUMK22_03805 [Mycobacterium kansasii]VAZ68419.1 hypothetical protein LAUMK40_04571 [Mycobacterium kansasii]VAZ78653.1 hypothetical protein LAUMK7_04432 [Mycobacterium kansasii]